MSLSVAGVRGRIRSHGWILLFLGLALGCAAAGYWARLEGQFYSALFLSGLSLALAMTVALLLTPRLLERLDLQRFGHFQTVRLTRRGAFFIGLVLVIGVATFNSGNNLLILLLSFLLAFLLVSGIVSNLVLQGLKVSLTLPDSIHVGQRAVFFLKLQNLKRFFPSFALKLQGRGIAVADRAQTDFFEQENFFAFLRPRQALTVKLRARFLKRGVYPVSAFYVETQFPFGFFSRRRRIEAEGKITIYPALMKIDELFAVFPWLQGPQVRHRKGVGTTLYNIREYQSGDEARHVHWKLSGKLSRLMVKNFSHEEAKPLRVILDRHVPVLDDRYRNEFEKTVSCAASLCRYYREQGMSLEFESGDFQLRLTGSKEEYDTVMEFLAWVEPAVGKIPLPDSGSERCLLLSACSSFEIDSAAAGSGNGS